MAGCESSRIENREFMTCLMVSARLSDESLTDSVHGENKGRIFRFFFDIFFNLEQGGRHVSICEKLLPALPCRLAPKARFGWRAGFADMGN